MSKTIERPGWLQPTWIALSCPANRSAYYADAFGIRAVSGRGTESAIVFLHGGGSLVVGESAEQVLRAIAEATRHG